MMYAWATPEYLLDHLSIEEVFLYYDQGHQFEEYKAKLIIIELDKALAGEPKKPKTSESQEPDKKKFYARHGRRIKRG